MIENFTISHSCTWQGHKEHNEKEGGRGAGRAEKWDEEKKQGHIKIKGKEGERRGRGGAGGMPNTGEVPNMSRRERRKEVQRKQWITHYMKRGKVWQLEAGREEQEKKKESGAYRGMYKGKEGWSSREQRNVRLIKI